MAVERKKATVALGVVTLIAALALSTLTVTAGASSSKANALPRAATLYTSGTAWGPFAQFNPLRTSGNATGTVGLLYETLFRYDPLADRYIPWLATNGKWVGNSYVVTLRRGVTWNDGKPLTGADVKFTFETGKLEGSELSTMWKTGLQAITVKGNIVSFRFKGQPNYLDWATNIFSFGIVPAHVWKNYSAKEITTGNTDKYFVGTGPFKYGAGKGTSGTLQWNRRAGWWATKALGMRMPMQYIVDIHNTQNTASLQNFLKNDIDLSNNFFPGIDKQIGGRIADLLLEGAVHALGEHRLACPQHDQGSAQRRRVPPGARDVDQHQPDRDGRLREHRREGEPDRPASDLEQVDRQGPGGEARVQVQHRAARRRCSRRTDTGTRTATASSRTRTAGRSTSG